MTATHLVVDGSNIATEGRTLPSLAQLDEAVRAFITARPHDNYTVIVDATFEHRIDASERKLYDEALAANELIVTPAGTVGRGDRFILEVAEAAGATVLSNDSFQEFHGDYKWLFDTGRLVGGRPVPGVGWIFVDRTPVRGPKSRQATREASRKRGPSSTTSRAASGPMPTPTSPPPRKRGGTKSPANKTPAVKATKATPKPKVEPKAEPKVAKEDGRRRGTARPQQALNDQLPFIEFIAEHLPGSTVEGEVVEFSSHGAYVQVGDVRCYIPLKNMATPAPRSAREVLERGDKRTFVVQSIEAARRGIDLALPGFGEIGEAPTKTGSTPEASRTRRRSPRPATDKTLADAASKDAAPTVDKAPAEAGAKQPESEATLAATKKAAGRKTAAKKRPAKKKAAAKKAPAKKRPAKKAAAKKATAKKATKKKATAKKATAKKRPAKKAAAKKATKKTTAKKRPAKKAAAKKATKKATAKKRPAKKKAAAKKATAKKRPAKKAAKARKPARKAAKKR